VFQGTNGPENESSILGTNSVENECFSILLFEANPDLNQSLLQLNQVTTGFLYTRFCMQPQIL